MSFYFKGYDIQPRTKRGYIISRDGIILHWANTLADAYRTVLNIEEHYA